MAEARTLGNPMPKSPVRMRTRKEQEALLRELRKLPTLATRLSHCKERDTTATREDGKPFSWRQIGAWTGLTGQQAHNLGKGVAATTATENLYSLAAFFRVRASDLDPDFPVEQDVSPEPELRDDDPLDRRLADLLTQARVTGIGAGGLSGQRPVRPEVKEQLIALLEQIVADQAAGDDHTAASQPPGARHR